MDSPSSTAAIAEAAACAPLSTITDPLSTTSRPVPPSMRDSLVRYGHILTRATKGGMFWRCARDEQRSTARMIAERLFGVLVPEEAALEHVQFSPDFEQCWLTENLNAETQRAQRGEA